MKSFALSLAFINEAQNNSEMAYYSGQSQHTQIAGWANQ